MLPEERYGYAFQYTSSNGGPPVTQQVVSSYTRLYVENGLVNGGKDRAKPNPFLFTRARIGIGNFEQTQWTVTSGAFKPNVTVTEGPYMEANYTSIGMRYTSADWSRVGNNAMAKIYNQLKGNNNLIVDLAEGHQTVQMVKNFLNLKQFARTFLRNIVKHKGYKKIGRGNTPDQNQMRLDYITKMWLEYRYGWQPLVYSIWDAADNLNRQCINTKITIKGRSGVRVADPQKDVGSVVHEDKYLKNYVASYRIEYGMCFRIPGGPKLSDWTSLNPLGIAYELMTLSFVLDWIVDVSGYLSLWENNALFSRDFIRGYETRSYLETYTYTWISTYIPTYTYFPNGSLASGGGVVSTATCPVRRSYKDRRILTQLPVPSGMTVKVKFGEFHQFDSVALIYQLFKSRIRGKT